MSAEAPPGDRRMKYPYTISAKIYNFPYRYYFKHAWLFRWHAVGLVLTAPIMMKITNAVNSPENKAKWAEIRRKEFSGESH